MAAGCPVVAAETDVSRQFLQNDELLAPVKDPLTLAGRICTLLADADRRREIGENLRATVAENYGIAKMVDATEAVYREILARVSGTTA